MKLSHQRMMSLDELRNRLQDRIQCLEERLKFTDPGNAVTFSNVKTELNVAKRRLVSLNEKSKGSTHENHQSFEPPSTPRGRSRE